MASYVGLPQGWSREEVVRKSGLSAGKTDIYYHGPDGKKYRSKPEIARELGEGYDLSVFDFKTGRMMSQSASGNGQPTSSSSSIMRRTKGKKPASAYDYTKAYRSDINLTLPVRQTASIFKQPVTVIRSHPDSKVRTDLKHGPPDSVQPKQLFWEKSLMGLKCCGLNEEVLQSIDLPSKIKGIEPSMTTENLLQSIAAALHLGAQPVVGQSHSQAKFLKNPTIHINTSQPLVQQMHISDDDVNHQEGRVRSARKKLEELLAAIEKSNREQIDEETILDQPDSPQDDIDATKETKVNGDTEHNTKALNEVEETNDQPEDLTAAKEKSPQQEAAASERKRKADDITQNPNGEHTASKQSRTEESAELTEQLKQEQMDTSNTAADSASTEPTETEPLKDKDQETQPSVTSETAASERENAEEKSSESTPPEPALE